MDASGFWGIQKENNRILYHKEPVTSSEFINKKIWKEIEFLNPNLNEKTESPRIDNNIYTNLNENEDVCFTKEVVVSLCKNINLLSNEIENNFQEKEYTELEIRNCSHKLALMKKEILNVLNFIKK